jgi:hypothetical protein
MNERIDDDYSDFLITEPEEVEEFVAPAKKYINYIEKLISNRGKDE